MEHNKIFNDIVGYLYNEYGVYEPDVITFTVQVDKQVEIGEIVCIEHPRKKGIPVFYQVVRVPVKRKAKSFEEDLIRMGKIMYDDTRNYPRAIAKQIGYYPTLEDLGKRDKLHMLLQHVTPQATVYRPSEEVLRTILKPEEAFICIGEIYPSFKQEMCLEIPLLIRQGLLVVGGVGTGKTTTMTTVIYNMTQQLLEKNKEPHILIIDKDGEYGSKKFIDLVGVKNYKRIHIDDIALGIQIFKSPEDFRKTLLNILNITPQSKEGKAIYLAVNEAVRDGDELRLTPDFVIEKIIPRIFNDEYKKKIKDAVALWRSHFSIKKEKLTTDGVVELLKKLRVVHLDLSKIRDWNNVFEKLANILKIIYDEAIYDENFGAIIVLDEAHLFAPERGGIELADREKVEQLKSVIKLIATTGPRNGVTPFFATQRPALIDKTITTQLGQNIIAHRVEDVDLARLTEVLGEIAKEVSLLPRGWALIKSAASKINQSFIVKVTPTDFPISVGKTAYYRFDSKPLPSLVSLMTHSDRKNHRDLQKEKNKEVNHLDKYING
ncbi:MAG: helicase HerA domain-containing protein [Candidatus Asgardarchaeia archaeon]